MNTEKRIIPYSDLKSKGLTKTFEEVNIGDTISISRFDVMNIDFTILQMEAENLQKRANELNADLINWRDETDQTSYTALKGKK